MIRSSLYTDTPIRKLTFFRATLVQGQKVVLRLILADLSHDGSIDHQQILHANEQAIV